MDVFDTADDRHAYIHYLRTQGERYGVEFLAYCLMSNHVHLIAVPWTRESLARAIGEAHRRYTIRVNKALGVCGYLFQGRFFSCPLDERHLIAAARYIERNPVRGGIAEQAWQYRWSSAKFHVGLHRSDPLVGDRTLFGLASDWKTFLRSDPEEMEELRKRVRTGRPCGSSSFLNKAEIITGRRLRPLPPGPPRKLPAGT